MATLSLRHVNKIYPNNVHAVKDFSLEVKDREFIVFVGPSGCGKSTTLRMIAGLEEISSGEFYMDGRLMNYVEPKDRDMAMVFQSYALYPHMSVYKNIAYGLSIRRDDWPIYEPSPEADAISKEAASLRKRIRSVERKLGKKGADEPAIQKEVLGLYDELRKDLRKIHELRKPVMGRDEAKIKSLARRAGAIEADQEKLSALIKKEKALPDGKRADDYIALMENDYRGESAELSAILKDIERYKSQDVALTKRRKLSKDEVDYEVIEAAYILGLVPYLSRFPSALSGGQRQRVALGRAIVRHPKLFLMDEPLSNLDAKLRVQMRGEISRIAKAVGATTIYVTHDQTEAMTLADRIVVMKDGCIQQIAKPMDAFKDPDNVFVAGFIGSPAMNFVKGKAENGVFHFPNGYDLPLSEKDKKMLSAYEGKEITLGIRPENVILAGDPRAPKDGKPLRINVESTELLGTEFIYYSKIGDAPFLVKSTLFKGGGLNDVYPDEGALYFFDEEGKRIRA